MTLNNVNVLIRCQSVTDRRRNGKTDGVRVSVTVGLSHTAQFRFTEER